MRKAGLGFVVLMLANLGLAIGQEIPKPPFDPDKMYPSAKVCGECHPVQYKQWSNSSHAYAAVSPMFNKFEQRINDLAQGTINSFCVRCHASVGTSLGDSRAIAWWDRSAAGQEGITCVTCHRVGEVYGKNNGARRVTPGDIHESVFGPFDSTGVLKAISDARKLKILVTSDEPDKPGYIRIHQQAIESDVLTKADFCIACHQVQVHAGIKLETVWEEYRASPAAKEGITCQQCHMSPVPGKPVPFPRGPAALVNGQTVNDDRPLSNHSFMGPGYAISHPGLFPIRRDDPLFTPQQWLTFDYRARWGSEPFENKVAAGQGSYTFPPEWQKADDRKKAWERVQDNYKSWQERADLRVQLLENGSHLDGPFFNGRAEVGKALSFNYKLTNINKGHNLPSGSLGAQPELWLNVALVGPDGGAPIWESGYVDSNGDFADLQSFDVQKGEVKFDDQLFCMQAKFITTNVKGTDREMYLPINLDFDQLPFIRPGGAPASVLNHPPFVRMEKRSIPPLASRLAKYTVPGNLIKKPGTYRLAVRLRARTEPIYFMNFVFATNDMIRSENEWITDTHQYAVAFDVH
jgi:nitrate/TMAO reductase-like tetraheme cytochrome c subunit